MANNKNQAAEQTLSVISTIILVIGLIVGTLGIIGGLVFYFNVEDFIEYEAYNNIVSAAMSGIFGGVKIIIGSLVQWAIIKVFVNISRNTASLDSRLENIENKLQQ